MATAEQVQEALQQLQARGARIAALETQLQFEQNQSNDGRTRKERVDSDSGSDANCGGVMVNTKVIGQPFMLKGLQNRTSASGHTKCACLHGSEIRFSLL